jgi:hypothetical protein
MHRIVAIPHHRPTKAPGTRNYLRRTVFLSLCQKTYRSPKWHRAAMSRKCDSVPAGCWTWQRARAVKVGLITPASLRTWPPKSWNTRGISSSATRAGASAHQSVIGTEPLGRMPRKRGDWGEEYQWNGVMRIGTSPLNAQNWRVIWTIHKTGPFCWKWHFSGPAWRRLQPPA